MVENSSVLNKIIKTLTDIVAGIAVFGVLVVVLLQVASRLLGMPVSWTEEATRYLFVWMIFLGLAAGFRTVETARVVVFLALLPRFVQRLSVPIYVVTSVIFFALTGWTGYQLVKQQFMMNETTATLIVPMWMIGIIMPLSSILAVLAIFESLRTRRQFIEISDPVQTIPEIRHAEAVSATLEKQP